MLNWGASYMVHDFYRRFLFRRGSERHYVFTGRLATVGLFLCAAGLTFVLDTAKDAFDLILQVGAGTGLLYLLRWFWWRVNAWCEVVAMVSSFGVSVFWLVMKKWGPADFQLSTQGQLLATVALTTACWVATAFITRLNTDHDVLVEFYRKVRPFGPGWRHIARQVALSPDELDATQRMNIPLAMTGWVAGTVTIWSGLFALGNFLYGRMDYAAVLSGVFIISGAALIRVVNRLWVK